MTFLYELKDGACPKSYGTACARLAGMPEAILAKAEHLAAQLEDASLPGSAGAVSLARDNRLQRDEGLARHLKELSRCLSSCSGTTADCAASASGLLKLQAEWKSCAMAS